MANNPYVSKVQYGNNVLIDLTSDTVAANKMLSGTTAHDKSGAVVTGNIPSKSGQTYTPTTSVQVIPTGRYLSGDQIIEGSANLLAENIKKDVNIFGVVGTLESGGGARLPAEYQEVEYIQTDGRAYIDTGYYPDGSGKVICDFYVPTSAVCDMWGIAESSGTKRFMLSRYPANSNSIFIYATGTSTYQNVALYYSSQNDINGRWLSTAAIMDTTTSTYNERIVDFEQLTGNAASKTLVTYNFTVSLPIFAQHYNGALRFATSGTRCRKFELYGGTSFTLVRNLVPCYRKADNVIGMYDLAAASGGTVFYTNAGSGAFTKGADV